jgi:hypothetical protein
MQRYLSNYDPFGSAVAAGTYQRARSTDMRAPGGALGALDPMQKKHAFVALAAFVVGAWFATKTKTGRKLWR